jgi:hypothetical protein
MVLQLCEAIRWAGILGMMAQPILWGNSRSAKNEFLIPGNKLRRVQSGNSSVQRVGAT